VCSKYRAADLNAQHTIGGEKQTENMCVYVCVRAYACGEGSSPAAVHSDVAVRGQSVWGSGPVSQFMCSVSALIVITSSEISKADIMSKSLSRVIGRRVWICVITVMILMFCWPWIVVYQYNETNVMHLLFSLLRSRAFNTFRALPAHPKVMQVMLEICRGPWFSINWMKSASRWFHYTDTVMIFNTWKQTTIFSANATS
jgi:hypothetical protein